MPARRHRRAKKKTVSTPPKTKFHQSQLPAMPLRATSSVTARGVSVAKVVATMEVPASHQGRSRPERKNSSRSRPARRARSTPSHRLGWVFGAVLCACDGLVWAELGAAMPEAGGPVRYLRAMYGPRLGRFLSFLFVWQLTFSAPLSMASGCIGFAQYAAYLWPSLSET